MATYKPYVKTTSGKEEIKLPYAVLTNTPTIPQNVVQYTAQTLTSAQKSQARINIGAGSGNGTVKSVKINGSTKSPDSAGLVDLGTISGGGGSSPKMPIIRLVTVKDVDGTMEISETNPLIFTIEVLEGEVLPTDTLQICYKCLYTYKKGHKRGGGTKVYDREYKLRKFAEVTIQQAASGNFYVVSTNNRKYGLSEFFRSYRAGATEGRGYTKYIRIRRALSSNNAIFSNAIPVTIIGGCSEQAVKIRVQ